MRVATVSIGLSVAAAAAALVLALQTEGEAPTVEFTRPDLRAARERLDESGGEPGTGAPWRRYRYHLSEEVVNAIKPRLARDEGLVYDPFAYFVAAPGRTVRRRFAEHPDGRLHKTYNAHSFQRAGELAFPRPERTVVVTGDSHVDGICATHEGLPARLEASLREGLADPTLEVLNAAVGGYSLYHYRGTLERCLHVGVRPDVFVVVLFGGNDFNETLQLGHLFRRTAPPQREVERRGCLSRFTGPVAQGLLAVDFFDDLPGEVATARDVMREGLLELAGRCGEVGAELVVVYLPSPVEQPGQADAVALRAARECLGLPPESVDVLGELATATLDAVRGAGVGAVDLRVPFSAHDGRLYWDTDLHLDLEGHRVAAESVLPAVLAALEDS